MDPSKKRLIWDINKAGSSYTRPKLKPIKEEDQPTPIVPSVASKSTDKFSLLDDWSTFKEQERIYAMANPSSFESRRDPQNLKSPTEEKSFATLHRLENEDVVDRNNVLRHDGAEYFEVIDPELKTFFKETFGQIDKLQHTTNKFVYIGREDRVFRKPIQISLIDEKKEKRQTQEDDSITSLASKLAQQSLASNEQENLSEQKRVGLPSDFKSHSVLEGNNQGARPKTPLCSPRKRSQDFIQPSKLNTFKTINPPIGWTNDIYNDIEQTSNDDTIANHKYIEAKTLKSKKPARRLSFKDETEIEEVTLLSAEYLEKLSREVNELKKKELDILKDKYFNAVTTFNVSNSQYMLSKQQYDIENDKPDNRNEAFIASHLSLKRSILDQKAKLKALKTQIEDLVNRKSPYYLNEIPMPKLGNREHFDPEELKLFPTIMNDDDISIKDLFVDQLSPWAEDLGLSEKALKRAIQTRLRGSRQKAWFQYQKQPLKEAITSLSLLFDKSESPQKYYNQIKEFRKHDGEDIQNSLERLISAVNKYLENYSEHDKKVLRLEIIKEKLEKLLSTRALREIFRKMEEKHQLGEEITEKELISSIYKEDLFDRRSEGNQRYISLQNVNINDTCVNDDNDVYGDLCEDFNELELNAAEQKRRADISADDRQSFKYARTHDRPILNPVRKQSPIVVGSQGKPLIKVGNPNPNNRWHSRINQNSLQNEKLHPSSYNPRREFMNSRNAPLEQQNEVHPPRYNPRREFMNSRNAPLEQQNDRYHPAESYRTNNFRGGYRAKNFQQTSYGNRTQFRQNRNGFTPNRPGLRHNMEFRTNPPEIQQRISLEELNSICVQCPKEEGQHTVRQCPFHLAPNQTGQT